MRKTRGICGPLIMILVVYIGLFLLFVINTVRFLLDVHHRAHPTIYPIAIYAGLAAFVVLQIMGAKEQGERHGDS